MRKFLKNIFVLCISLPMCTQGQGTFHFSNLGSQVNAPVFDFEGNPLSGSGYLASLYVGPTTSSLELATLGTRPFMAGAFAGYIIPENVFAYNVNGGALVWLQVKAWDLRAGSTYEDAVQSGMGGYGQSSLFQLQAGSNDPGVPPPPLIGLESFSVLPLVPEPNPFFLILFGLTSFWMARSVAKRRK